MLTMQFSRIYIIHVYVHLKRSCDRAGDRTGARAGARFQFSPSTGLARITYSGQHVIYGGGGGWNGGTLISDI